MTQAVEYCHWSICQPHRQRRHSTLSWSCDTEVDGGETIDEYTFRRKDQVVTLGTKSFIKLLFQRLIIVAQTSDELESACNHELCSYQPTMFDTSLLHREAHTPALGDAIWVLLVSDVQADVPNKDSRYVLDRGAVIQRIPWYLGSTYRRIVNQCTDYVTHSYRDVVVVCHG